jgi:hypothetical protein
LKSSNNKSYSLLQKLHIHIYLKFWSKGRISFDQINSSLFKDFWINGKGHYLAWAWPILLFLGQPSGQRRCVPPLSPCPGLPISPSPSPVPCHTRAVKSHAAQSNGLEPLPHAVGPPLSPSTNVCCPPPYSTCPPGPLASSHVPCLHLQDVDNTLLPQLFSTELLLPTMAKFASHR